MVYPCFAITPKERKKERKKKRSANPSLSFLCAKFPVQCLAVRVGSNLRNLLSLSVADDVFLVLLGFDPVLFLLSRWSFFGSRIANRVLTGLSDHLEGMALGFFIDGCVAVDIIQTIIPKACVGCPLFVRCFRRSENTDGLFELIAFDHALCVLCDSTVRLFSISATVVQNVSFVDIGVDTSTLSVASGQYD